MKNPETLFMGQNLIHLADVDSTNNFAAILIKQTKVIPGTVILADNQTQGRGQSGNIWEVEAGANLTFTLILQPKIPIEDQFILSKITCLALADTLAEFDIQAAIKWPNDILVNQKKISGILIENTVKGKLVETSLIGVGLNVNQDFDGNLNALSLSEILNEKQDKRQVLHLFLKFMEKWYFIFEKGSYDQIDDSYKNSLFGLNQIRTFSSNESEFEGTIKGVNKLGQLEIQIADQSVKTFNNKEVKFLLD